MRVGIGYDIHQLVKGRRLVLGGVPIPFEKGPKSHSDGDVLLHALTDALLGACGLGDIGQHFPNTDPVWRDAKSRIFVQKTMELLNDRRFNVVNVDASIFAEAPKLITYVDRMCENIAELLRVQTSCINVKAGTNEGCDAVGRGEAIAAEVIVLVTEKIL